MGLRHKYNMILEFSSLDWNFGAPEDINNFLKTTGNLINNHMQTNHCHIYLWDDSLSQLIFNEDTPKDVIGFCSEINDFQNTRYSDKNRKMMCHPIRRGPQILGVMFLSRNRKPFTIVDERIINLLSQQLGNIIETARRISTEKISGSIETGEGTLEFNKQILMQGVGASPGMALGLSYTLDRKRRFNELQRTRFKKKYSLEELDSAISATKEQIKKLQQKVEKRLSDDAALIFTSHLLILDDTGFRNEISSMVYTGINPPAALLSVANKYINVFSASDNPLVQEKADDMEDLVFRIFANLIGEKTSSFSADGRIIIARSIYPSDILALASENCAGLMLVSGGVTAHISILAQSLKLPLVIIDFNDILKTSKPVPIAIDGTTGRICINPEQELVEEFHEVQRTERQQKDNSSLKKDTVTRDGTGIKLLSNINLISDLEEAMAIEAEGIGLYRTEYQFLLRNNFPTENEQYKIYKQIIDLADGRPVTFRTLDAGGDKVLSYYSGYKEENPFLGLRSIRFSLQNPIIFNQQIRALLRAAGSRKIKIMFPMISTLEELRTAKSMVIENYHNLTEQGLEIKMPEIGAMIEIPSLLVMIDHVCEEVDFLSIGTNDFIQYMLAVDRNNEKLSGYYNPHNPSVLRGLKIIADACNKFNIDLTVCGEMAHQKEYLPFLIGIGIRSLSVSTGFLKETQEAIAGISTAEAVKTAERSLNCSSLYEIEQILGIV